MIDGNTRLRARSALLALLFAIVLAVVVAACSGDPAEQGVETSPTGEQTPVDPPPDGGPPPPASSEPAEPTDPSGVTELSTEPVVPALANCARPYADSSPWNTPIGDSPAYHPDAQRFISAFGERLTSDPSQFTYPVYTVTNETPLQRVFIEGWFSNVSGDGRLMENENEVAIEIPIPPDAQQAAGDDAQIIIINEDTGEEWGAWRFERVGEGEYQATNAYHYHVGWDAVPPPSTGGGVFVNRGAGVPYLAGLVRPCEIEAGRIDHALAFAYDSPTEDYVYPATKSDGQSKIDRSLPEGARLQLDPALTEDDLAGIGCTGPCLTIARALQEYGMFIIDNSGRAKVMLEFNGTAEWNGVVDETTVAPLTFNLFRALDTRTIPTNAGCTITGTPGDDVLIGTRSADVICGLAGDDELRGLDGNDLLYGGEGSDLLLGGAGQDRLDAGNGPDTVSGGGGADVLDGGAGRDDVIGGPGTDRIIGNDGDRDSIDGGPGRDEAEADQNDALKSVEISLSSALRRAATARPPPHAQ